MKNQVLVNFIYYLTCTKNCSTQTIKAYQKDILIFLNFIKEYWQLEIEIKDINIFLLSRVTETMIYSYLIYLNEYRNNTASTRKRRVASLRTFYKFLYNKYYPNFCYNNPLKYIKPIPLAFHLPKYLNLEQAGEIKKIFNKYNCSNPIRNNTIISVFLMTGIRLSELVSLSITDFNFEKEDQFVLIKVKGNKEKSVYFCKSVMQQIKTYLGTRTDSCNALFISNRKTRISIDAVADICKKGFELIGIKDNKYSTHSLRHTAAILIYNQTKDLLVTKQFLNHSNISSTQIYAHIEDENVRNAVNSNPLANFKI